MVEAERVAATNSQGVHGRRRVGTGESFWQFRRYQEGDSASAIDWRQSAKRIPIYIRQNEWEAAQSVWLWRDASPSMAYRSNRELPAKADRATVLLLALAALLLRGGEHVGLLGDDRTARSGRATLDHMTARLLRPATATSLPAPAPLPRHAQIVLIGDFLAPLEDMHATIRGFAAAGAMGHLLQIVDPAESDLPFAGRVRFEGVEGEGDFLAGRAESLRESYFERLEARHEALKAMARTTGWTFASHRTDRSPQTALLALYAALTGGPLAAQSPAAARIGP